MVCIFLVLFQNPDGTLSEGVPPGFKDAPLRVPTRIGFSSNGLLWGELDTLALREDVLYLHHKHQVLGAIYYMVKLLLIPILYGGLYDVFTVAIYKRNPI